jgi:hypothetical protein
MPYAVNGSQLMNPAVVGMEEVASFGNSLDVFRTQDTLHPLSWPHALAMLPLLQHHVDAVADFIFDTRRLGGHQTPGFAQSLNWHASIDARGPESVALVRA